MANVKKWNKVWTDSSAAPVKNYDKIHDIYVPERKELLTIIADNSKFIKSDSKILIDLGCGTGAAAFSILQKHNDAKAILIDGSKPMIKTAEMTAEKSNYNVKTICSDLSDSGWIKKCRLNKKYQLIVSSLMIHHLTDKEKYRLFKDIYDILIPGGIFIYADLLKMNDKKSDDMQYDLWIEKIINAKKKAKMEVKPFELEKSFLIKANNDQGDMPATQEYILNCFDKIGFKEYCLIWFYVKFGVFKAVK